jgi:hypothetical protein
MKTIEGESWKYVMTDTEYDAWVKYDESHPHLSSIPVQQLIAMFLTNYRMLHKSA